MKHLALRVLAVASSLLVCSGGSYALQEQNPPPDTQDQSQAQPPPAPSPKPQFFAGMITSLDPERITVSRSLVGKAPESRTFLIQKRTKVSKGLKPKQRVTVRYQKLPEGDVALEIQIRQPRAGRTSS